MTRKPSFLFNRQWESPGAFQGMNYHGLDDRAGDGYIGEGAQVTDSSQATSYGLWQNSGEAGEEAGEEFGFWFKPRFGFSFVFHSVPNCLRPGQISSHYQTMGRGEKSPLHRRPWNSDFLRAQREYSHCSHSERFFPSWTPPSIVVTGKRVPALLRHGRPSQPSETAGQTQNSHLSPIHPIIAVHISVRHRRPLRISVHQ